ncbi:hypothetical protein GGR54DRAFT_522013 [Hypoxylon sp. NC1633]|nr:hypothetical protein GGR54DRAFT_522013 [Hypoxylon sp. NC1633]
MACQSESLALSEVVQEFHQDVHPYQPIPLVLDAYYQSKIITRVFHLGEPTNKRLFAVSVHTGTGSKPMMTLHNGPTEKDPMLAAAGEGHDDHTFPLDSIITLPELSSGTSGEMCTEIMRSDTSLDRAVFRFSIEVGQKGELQREDFEWRRCQGDEVKKFVTRPWTCGFQLVRLSCRAGQKTDSGNGADPRTSGEDEDVVALFAWNHGLSLLHPFRIDFRGSGQTGILGERFSLMTIITGLRLWGLKHQGRTSPHSIRSSKAGMPYVPTG